MTEVTNSDAGWLSREDMDAARDRLPILYVDAVPVRVDDQEYYPEHRDGLFYLRTNDTSKNFRLVVAPAESVTNVE